MTSSLPESTAPPKRQAVKVTGITFVLTSVANKISDPYYKDWLVSLSPLIGYVLHLAYTVISCEISFLYFEYRIKRIVNELTRQKTLAGCTSNKIRDIDKDIADMHLKLKERRLKDLNIKF